MFTEREREGDLGFYDVGFSVRFRVLGFFVWLDLWLSWFTM